MAPLSAAGGRLQSVASRALAPHWGALLALTLFLVGGLAVLDDYGLSADEEEQRRTAEATLGYLANGDHDAFLAGLLNRHNKFYGVAFEAPLLLVERAFRLGDRRGVHLFRHLVTHIFFLTGGLFAYLLARRLFGVRMLALFAMPLFLLHPRLYAHSFFNTKDIPFLIAFIVALFLAHRAFKRDTLLAFALLGVGVGIAVNLRIMGVVLLAAIPLLRALDFAWGRGWMERKRALLTTGAFALASLLTVYALLPYLWAGAARRLIDWGVTLSSHPYADSLYALYRGEIYRSSEFPPDYLSVWASITSPPFALLLGLIGATAVCIRGARTFRSALRNTRLRFGLLTLGCAAAPILLVILLDINVYDGWRQAYFLWAPFSVLGAFGLQWLAAGLRRARLSRAAFAAAGLGVAATLASMALIHPNQQVFFNFFEDRATQEHLRNQYVMDYWGHSHRQALEWLADRAHLLWPPASATTGSAERLSRDNAAFLPGSARERVAKPPGYGAFAIGEATRARPDLALHRVQVYGNTLLTIERKPDLREAYAETLSQEPILNAVFDVHRMDDSLTLVKEPCAPSFVTKTSLMARTTPVDASDLPAGRRSKGFDAQGYPLTHRGAFFDGKCVASVPLPGYPVKKTDFEWSPELLDDNAAREAMRRARENGRLLARSAYDVHLADGELVYIQEPCDPLETEQPFRVSVFPERASDLPEQWRGRGHERFWFAFHQRGALLADGACVALFPLPDYPIAGIRTAQYTEGGDDLWQAAFPANPEPYAAAYRAVAGSEPLARGAFDLHLLDGDLVYVKEPCGQADTEARFFLHIVPERAEDLPEARREFGFDNLDFRFFLNGARFDAQCAARVPLPPYPIASVRTGQFVSGVGEIWRAEFSVER